MLDLTPQQQAELDRLLEDWPQQRRYALRMAITANDKGDVLADGSGGLALFLDVAGLCNDGGADKAACDELAIAWAALSVDERLAAIT